MKSSITSIFVCLSILIVFEACQSGNTENEVNSNVTEQSISAKPNSTLIAPPLENVDVSFKKMTVQAEKGGQLSLDNGTQIIVPEGAFVDADGQPITGEVAIKYREFHNAADIIASGIPMTNSTGDKYMQTAGMFEIRGEHKETPVHIAEGKSLEVKMASFVNDGQQYEFFQLDEEGGDWQTLGTADVEKNPVKIQKLKNLPTLPEKPTKPEAPTEEAFKFNFNVNYQKFPELRAYEGVIWQYAGNTTATNPKENEWIFDEDWADISLEKIGNGRYKFILKSSGNTFSSEVQPVFEGKNLQKAMADFEKRQGKYNEIKEQRIEEEERLVQEADFLRSYQVQDFGVFNWDVWKDPNREILTAKFDFGSQINPDVNHVTIFLITASKRSVVKYKSHDFHKFSFDPNQENELVAVLPGNKLAKFTAQDFRTIDIQSIKNNKSYTFKMKVHAKSIESVDDLEGALASK